MLSTICRMLTGDHSHMTTYADMADGAVKGYFIMGENPVVGSMNGAFSAQGDAPNWNGWWCATSRRPRPRSSGSHAEISAGKSDRADRTEVFFFPVAAHTEKDGSFTNTQRLLQWHHTAIEPPGDCRSELHFMYHLGVRLKRMYRDSSDPKDRPIQRNHLGVSDQGPASRNRAPKRSCTRSTDARSHREPIAKFTELKDDGSTACGCWIYTGCYKDGVNQTARRKPAEQQDWVAPEWGVGVAGSIAACFTTVPPPIRKAALVRAQEVRLVG